MQFLFSLNIFYLSFPQKVLSINNKKLNVFLCEKNEYLLDDLKLLTGYLKIFIKTNVSCLYILKQYINTD